MKKLLALILVLVIALTFTACGGEKAPAPSEAENEGTQQQSEIPESSTPPENSAETPVGEELGAWLGTKTGKFYSQFQSGKMYMEYEVEYEGMTTTVISATSGDKTYSESKVDGTSAGVSIMDGEYMYTVDHNNKMVIKMAIQSTGAEMMDTMIEEGDIDPANLVSGTREIDGKTYETEEWSIDEGKSILCFDGDKLAYMIGEFDGEEIIMKIVKTDSSVDESLFEIPSDYQVIEY